MEQKPLKKEAEDLGDAEENLIQEEINICDFKSNIKEEGFVISEYNEDYEKSQYAIASHGRLSLKKPKCLTLQDKSLVIQELNDGASVTSLSKKYGVAKATICKIRNKKQTILHAVADTYIGPCKRKTLKCSELPKTEKELYEWFLDRQKKKLKVSGKMIRQKAISLHSVIKESKKEFTASEGWLQRFKRRFGIRFLFNSERSQPEFVDPFKMQLKHKIQELGITLDHLYNAHESGLYWKLLPDTMLASSSEKITPDRKTKKDRFTFLACTNATGHHKLRPLFIGKDVAPGFFKNFACHTDYEHSESGYMTAVMFKNWFYQSFIPQVRNFLKGKGLPIKALLLLDNAPCHPIEDELISDDGQIITMFLPPYVSPQIKPMNENVIRLTKLYYRNSLLASIVANDSNIGDTLRNLTVKDAIINLMTAWNRLDTGTVAKCWKHLLEDEEDLPVFLGPVSESLHLLHLLVPQISFKESDVLEWNSVDNQCENDKEECEVEAEERPQEIPNTVSTDSVINAFNVAVRWAETYSVNSSDLLILKRLREKAIMQKIENRQKQ